MKKVIFIILILSGLAFYSYHVERPKIVGSTIYLSAKPLNPGSLNPNIFQANISENICNKKWSTKSIRPPTSYTNKLKMEQIDQFGLTDKNMGDYEEDHIISLEIGGNPTDPQNLYPEPYTLIINGENLGAHQKDKVENALHREVCNGTLTLKEAQTIISTDWVAYYEKIK